MVSFLVGALASVASLSLPPDTTGYWQQRVSYAITASLDEPSGVLTGRVTIGYVNQSPDTLREFAVHQYLNAFRPGSRWAGVDSAEQRVRFQRLRDPDYAFERITAATVMGAALAPSYPFSPDSTVAQWALPRPLAPGDSMTVEIAWQARPSTLPRRQGRQGRRFDFAQWYPKVVVYDKLGWQARPLYPAGEFYGEFARYDVTLDLPADQVIGATGVPTEGDPGWERARADAGTSVDYQRDWYAEAEAGTHSTGTTAGPPDRLTARCGAVREGRKCVRFVADSVHHFAFSLNPEYIYEQGRYGDVAVRVLYLPQDRATWGNGIAVGRTVAALAWLDSLFGKFPWPQISNVHRIEGGGTEFPMMVMNGGAGMGLIVHEVGHNYTMGVLANNEWREAWLDEGFTSFQSAWFFEAQGEGSRYRNLEGNLLFWDLERWSEPVSMISDRYRDFTTYGTMVYSKAHLFFEQLRYVVGDDTMRRILREYYARWRLKHVDEGAFRAAAEDVSGMDLGWLFGQWLHGTPLIDYELARVERTRLPDDRWRTVVTVRRRGDGWMPVEIGDGRTVYARATGQPEFERVEFVSTTEPGRLLLDPRFRAHDWNALNNREKSSLWGRTARQLWIDNPMLETARRDRLVTALFPVAWANDAGGPTFALRVRESYLGRFEKNLFVASFAVGDSAPARAGIYARLGNPVGWFAPRTEQSVAAWWLEGRAGAELSIDRALRRHPSFGAEPHAGFRAVWMATTNLAFLDPRLWDDAGTVEAGPWVATSARRGDATWRARLDARGGLVYRIPGPGVVANQRYDVEAFGRATGEISVRTPTLGARVFAGAYLADNPPPRQRRIMLAGADPYETFANPLLRSDGALFVRDGFHYHAPGGANLRGFRPDLGGRWAVGANLEGSLPLWRRRGGFVTDVGLATFVDLGVVDPLAVPPSPAGRSYTTLYDAGVGLVARHRLGDRSWVVRLELPALVNRWDHAADVGDATGAFAFRWQVSLQSSF